VTACHGSRSKRKVQKNERAQHCLHDARSFLLHDYNLMFSANSQNPYRLYFWICESCVVQRFEQTNKRNPPRMQNGLPYRHLGAVATSCELFGSVHEKTASSKYL
jgi:hypothetical protein